MAFFLWIVALCVYDNKLLGPFVVAATTIALGALPGLLVFFLWGALVD